MSPQGLALATPHLVVGQGLVLPQEESWYAVYSRPTFCPTMRAERLAYTNLIQQGYQAFYPHIVNGERERPFFPRYLFCAVSPGQPIGPIRYTRGVVDLVGDGTRPLRIPQLVINALRNCADPKGQMPDDAFTNLGFRVGQRVRIISGPFADFLGEISHLDRRGRAALFLDLFSRSVEALIPLSGIVPEGPPPPSGSLRPAPTKKRTARPPKVDRSHLPKPLHEQRKPTWAATPKSTSKPAKSRRSSKPTKSPRLATKRPSILTSPR